MIIKPVILISNDVIEHPEEFSVTHEFGMVEDGSTGKKEITIIFDPDCYKNTNDHLCCTKCSEGSYIIMDSQHFQCYQKDPEVFEALLLHEIGHISNGDFDHSREKVKAIALNRNRALSKGFVLKNELDADHYAAQNIGVPAVLRMLDYCIEKRKLRENDPAKESAIKEFQFRKTYLQKNN